jgi:23S rRNA pseudouridine1911/1915/1917 synthase
MNILYEDNHLIAVVKPVGTVVQADDSNDYDLLNEIKEYRRINENKPGNVFVGLIHRLDRMVGGVMVFAKTSKAAGRLSEQVRTRNVRKLYMAVVRSDELPGGVMEDYLLKDPVSNTSRVVHGTLPGAKHARLRYSVLSKVDGLSLVSIELDTGRSHQIRVQFASRGWPLVGDVKYGLETGGTRGPALWSYLMGIEHPISKEPMEFAELPPNEGPWAPFADSLTALKLAL